MIHFGLVGHHTEDRAQNPLCDRRSASDADISSSDTFAVFIFSLQTKELS